VDVKLENEWNEFVKEIISLYETHQLFEKMKDLHDGETLTFKEKQTMIFCNPTLSSIV
jgi:hypothetical protein